jgi:hypothetical protein
MTYSLQLRAVSISRERCVWQWKAGDRTVLRFSAAACSSCARLPSGARSRLSGLSSRFISVENCRVRAELSMAVWLRTLNNAASSLAEFWQAAEVASHFHVWAAAPGSCAALSGVTAELCGQISEQRCAG